MVNKTLKETMTEEGIERLFNLGFDDKKILGFYKDNRPTEYEYVKKFLNIKEEPVKKVITKPKKKIILLNTEKLEEEPVKKVIAKPKKKIIFLNTEKLEKDYRKTETDFYNDMRKMEERKADIHGVKSKYEVCQLNKFLKQHPKLFKNKNTKLFIYMIYDWFGSNALTLKETIKIIQDFLNEGYINAKNQKILSEFMYFDDFPKELFKSPTKKLIKDINEEKEKISKLDKDIERENEEWYKMEKERKYMNVKKEKIKVMEMKVYIEIDKTGKKLHVSTNFHSDVIPTNVKKEVLKILSENITNHIYKHKKKSDIKIMKGGKIVFDSDSD
jgi:hypothetical protein